MSDINTDLQSTLAQVNAKFEALQKEQEEIAERQAEIAKTEASIARQREKLASKEGQIEQRLLSSAALLDKLKGGAGGVLNDVRRKQLFESYFSEVVLLARLMG